MSCTKEDFVPILQGIRPPSLQGLGELARRIPRDQDTKINAGPFGNITRLDLRSELRNYVNDAFRYYNFLYVLYGPLLNKDETFDYAHMVKLYGFDLESGPMNRREDYLEPVYYSKTFHPNLVPENPFDPNTGIQVRPEFKDAFMKCRQLFSTKTCPQSVLDSLSDEIIHDLDTASDLYSETYLRERGGRKNTVKRRRHKKKKTLKKRR
jgi:hypothetical protein